MFVPVSDEEIPAVAVLMNRVFRTSDSPAAWSTGSFAIPRDRTSEARLRAEIAQKPAASLLRWAENRSDDVIGCVWLEPLGGGTWYVGTLVIEPDRQGAGLGRIMLSAAERWIVDRGGRRIRLTVVDVRDTLIAWYLRRGYHLTGETEPFPYDHELHGPLREGLSLALMEKELCP